jgi:hypothetical protein
LVDTGSNSTIVWNTITNASGYAVALLSTTSHMAVRFNTFIDNGHDCQVLDDGMLNEISHNYYSDWLSPDDNADGYVDLPYEIEGASENFDPFPLSNTEVIHTKPAGPTTLGNVMVLVPVVGLFILIGTLFVSKTMHESR